ncbi:MAG: hypothetical protein COA47_07575 [Robiginitomaculum sp.]|nr:MAG: hypothetical protein COA47_07575 [Robiginitomaculum sp.]
MTKKRILTGAVLAFAQISTGSAFADDAGLMPYQRGTAPAAEVRSSLNAAGFEIVGEYSPYANAQIIAISNDALRSAAAESDFGGYGAALRVSITTVDGVDQIAYNNPAYISNIYRMNSDLSAVQTALEGALGNQGQFGAKKGLSAERLRKYRYKIGMPGFMGHMKIAAHGSYAEAVAAVEAGLNQHKLGVGKVYRVDVPGKDETLFGVSLSEAAEDAGDAHVMATVDKEHIRSTPHLSYEILVSGDTAYMLGGRFRIAQSFPSLTMGTFMKINSSPGAIKKALKEAANGAE